MDMNDNDTVRYDTYFPAAMQLDWDSPKAGRVTFTVTLERFDRISQVNFEIDLLRFSVAELRRLGDFLLRRQLGLAPATEIVAGTSWLLDCGIQQEKNYHGSIHYVGNQG